MVRIGLIFSAGTGLGLNCKGQSFRSLEIHLNTKLKKNVSSLKKLHVGHIRKLIEKG